MAQQSQRIGLVRNAGLLGNRRVNTYPCLMWRGSSGTGGTGGAHKPLHKPVYLATASNVGEKPEPPDSGQQKAGP